MTYFWFFSICFKKFSMLRFCKSCSFFNICSHGSLLSPHKSSSTWYCTMSTSTWHTWTNHTWRVMNGLVLLSQMSYWDCGVQVSYWEFASYLIKKKSWSSSFQTFLRECRWILKLKKTWVSHCRFSFLLLLLFLLSFHDLIHFVCSHWTIFLHRFNLLIHLRFLTLNLCRIEIKGFLSSLLWPMVLNCRSERCHCGQPSYGSCSMGIIFGLDSSWSLTWRYSNPCWRTSHMCRLEGTIIQVFN
jgi:hypothetical protein